MTRIRSSVRFVGSLVLPLGLLLVLFSSVVAVTQTWVPTKTQAIGPVLANATSQGVLPDSTPIHINVGLQIQNRDALAAYVQHISTPGDPLYGQELEPADFIANYAPSTSQVQAVVNYLSGAGWQKISVEPNSMIVSADGTALNVRQTFNTQLGAFLVNGSSVYANLSAAQVPQELGGIVGAVLGLNNAAKMSFPIATHAVSLPNFPGAYRPADLWTAYDVGGTPTGSKTAIAIFAEGNVSGVISDLRLAEKNNKLPQVPVKVVQVGIASPDTSGADRSTWTPSIPAASPARFPPSTSIRRLL